jgi:hypothetical protein
VAVVVVCRGVRLSSFHNLQLVVATAVPLIARPCQATASYPHPAIRRKSKRALSACGSCALAPSPTRNCSGCANSRCRGVPFSIGCTNGGAANASVGALAADLCNLHIACKLIAIGQVKPNTRGCRLHIMKGTTRMPWWFWTFVSFGIWFCIALGVVWLWSALDARIPQRRR